jgi:hypothetical protein
MKLRTLLLVPALAFAGLAFAADVPEFTLTIKDHKFEPAELTVPAGQKLKREKVIPGGATANIFVGPLKAGEYPFFGEFNPKTAQGKLIVK